MTDSGQAIIDWYEKTGYSYKEPYNSDEAQTQLDQILSVAKNKARTPREADKFRTGTPIGRGIDSTISDDLERLNREYLNETTSKIRSSTRYSDIKAIEINKKYLPETISDIDSSIRDKSSELTEDSIVRIRSSNTEKEIEDIISEASGTKYQSSLRKEGNFRIKDLKRRGVI